MNNHPVDPIRVGKAILEGNKLTVDGASFTVRHRDDFAAFIQNTSAVVATALATVFAADTGELVFADGGAGAFKNSDVEPWQRQVSRKGAVFASAKVRTMLMRFSLRKNEAGDILSVATVAAIVLGVLSLVKHWLAVAIFADALLVVTSIVALYFFIKGDYDCAHPLAWSFGFGVGMIFGHLMAFGQLLNVFG